MNIVVDPELKSYIDPLTPEEHDALERSLLSEGCRDALVLWGEVLVDGHNRHGICQKHGLPFQTVQNPHFTSIEDVHLWMIDQHLGRRSVSDFQRGVLALRKKEIVSSRAARTGQASAGTPQPADDGQRPRDAQDSHARGADDSRPPWESADGATLPPAAGELPPPASLDSREAIARAAKLSSSQVGMIEKIQKHAAPEVVAAVRAGAISINAAAAVASLPADEQVAAAAAGKDELKAAARRARHAKKKPRTPGNEVAVEGTVEDGVSTDALQARIADLLAENHTLRERVTQLEQQLAA